MLFGWLALGTGDTKIQVDKRAFLYRQIISHNE